MSETRQPILVLGATGRQGGAVARALILQGWPVRAMVRNTLSPASQVLRDSGVEIRQGSFEDLDDIRAAMIGAEGVFSVLPGNLDEKDEVRIGCAIADLAAESGVSHLVYSSGASAGDKPTGVPRFDAKPRIEAHVRQSRLAWTIVRPMIFMEMLVRRGYGLDEGRYTFFLRPDQPMQVIAVEDIGRFVAAIFADRPGYAGTTLKIAGDTVTGSDLQAIFAQAAGRPIAYSRFAQDVLAASPDLRHMSESLETGPLSELVDLARMREINPGIVPFRTWLAGQGRAAFEQALVPRETAG